MNLAPGKWYYLDGAVISDEINEYGNFVIAECRRDGPTQDESNLRLMAASKELLEAIRPIAEHGEISAAIIANARAALAKAGA